MIVTQSHPTLCDPMDYTVHEYWTRILEWVAFPSSGGPSNLGIEPRSLYCGRALYQMSWQGIGLRKNWSSLKKGRANRDQGP